MLKAKKITRDLHHLTGYKIFGTYPTRNQKNTKNLDMSVYPVIEALEEFEVDFKKLYKVDFDDVFYDDAQGNYINLEILSSNNSCGNSYNWNSALIFHWQDIKVIDNYDVEHTYRCIQFHRYGDVRGNYTDFMVLDINISDDYEFWENIMESSRVECVVNIKGFDFYIDTDCMKECGVYNIFSDDLQIDDCDKYIDIYNDRHIKDIRKAIYKEYKEVIKTN